MDIAQLLTFTVKEGASDCHLSAGEPPMLRISGDLKRIDLPALTMEDVHAMVYDMMSDAQRKSFEETHECDFSLDMGDLARFRVNVFIQQRGGSQHDLERTGPAPRPLLDERLGEDSHQGFRKLGANLRLLVRREGVDDAIHGFGRAGSVEGPKHQVAGLRRRQSQRDRFQVAHLADEDDVRVFSQGGP